MRTDLSKREEEVLELIAWGAAQKEVAQRLGISTHTVDNTIRNIKIKVKRQKAAELSAYYFCTRFNISFDLSPLARGLASVTMAIMVMIIEFCFNPMEQTMIRVRRPRRARTEVRSSLQIRAGKSSSY